MNTLTPFQTWKINENFDFYNIQNFKNKRFLSWLPNSIDQRKLIARQHVTRCHMFFFLCCSFAVSLHSWMKILRIAWWSSTIKNMSNVYICAHFCNQWQNENAYWCVFSYIFITVYAWYIYDHIKIQVFFAITFFRKKHRYKAEY